MHNQDEGSILTSARTPALVRIIMKIRIVKYVKKYMLIERPLTRNWFLAFIYRKRKFSLFIRFNIHLIFHVHKFSKGISIIEFRSD